MFVILAAVLAMVVGGGNIRAALAPQFQRWAELGTVVNEREIFWKLYPYGLIDRIEWSDGTTYRVGAGKCFVVVTVRYARQSGVSLDTPPIDAVDVGEPRCN